MNSDSADWIYPWRQHALEDIADRIVPEGGKGRLLDVGCGDGHFMAIMRERGRILDPLANRWGVGGILYIGRTENRASGSAR